MRNDTVIPAIAMTKRPDNDEDDQQTQADDRREAPMEVDQDQEEELRVIGQKTTEVVQETIADGEPRNESKKAVTQQEQQQAQVGGAASLQAQKTGAIRKRTVIPAISGTGNVAKDVRMNDRQWFVKRLSEWRKTPGIGKMNSGTKRCIVPTCQASFSFTKGMLLHLLISHQVADSVVRQVGVTTNGLKAFYIQNASSFLGPLVRRDYGPVPTYHPAQALVEKPTKFDVDFVQGST